MKDVLPLCALKAWTFAERGWEQKHDWRSWKQRNNELTREIWFVMVKESKNLYNFYNFF